MDGLGVVGIVVGSFLFIQWANKDARLAAKLSEKVATLADALYRQHLIEANPATAELVSSIKRLEIPPQFFAVARATLTA